MNDITFLVVDDSHMIRRLVSSVIKNNLGANRIVHADNGARALDMLKEQKIDIILSDWEMPLMTGEELIYEVRSNREWADIPFIMMTSHGEKDYIMTAIQNGVSQYIVKPFTPKELVDKIHKSWNSASKRSSDRYAAIPEHQAALKIGGKTYAPRVVNISRTGAMLELDYNEDLKLLAEYELSLEVSMEKEEKCWAITPLSGIATRIELADSFHPNSKACYLALYFGAKILDKKVEDNLISFLKWLGSLDPDTISDETDPA